MIDECEIWINAADHVRLMSHLYPGDEDEHGAVLRAGIVQGQGRLRLLVQFIELANDGTDYVVGQIGYRALSPTFIHRHIVACRNERLAYLAVHNHDCDRSVAFSDIDLESHDRGYPALRDIGKGVPVGALVYGQRSVEADIWLANGQRLRLGEYRVIGRTIQRLYASPMRAPEPPEMYDRQLRMFGAAGQSALSRAKIAIVGLGGIGSLIAEYAGRLGVGNILLIDPDRIDKTNLSRVVGATEADVAAGRLKTQIAAELIRAANPNATIMEIPADVIGCDVATQLRDCDYIFLCADSMRARLVVNAVTHQYFVPTVQLGAKVRAGRDGALIDATSVARTIRAADGCLWCNGLIPSGLLALEAKSDEERKAQAYGTHEPNPSVITMNAVAAAQGINDFLFDFLGLREEGDETRYTNHQFLDRRLTYAVPRREDECPECVGRFGRGDALTLPCTK